MKGFDLPDTLLLGCADSASAVFSIVPAKSKKNSLQGFSPVVSQFHHVLSSDDVQLIKKMRLQSYYYCLDWGSIEPEPGLYDHNSLKTIRESIIQLRKSGVKVLLGLYHNNHPAWFQDMGSWNSPESPEIFEKYAEHIAHQLGDVVSEWVSIDDPDQVLKTVFSLEENPPTWSRYLKSVNNLIEAHVRTYLMVHNIRKLMGKEDTRLAPVIRARHLKSAQTGWLDRFALKVYQRMHQDIFLAGMLEGNRIFPLGMEKSDGVPRYCDYIGLAYFGSETRIFDWSYRNQFSRGFLTEGTLQDDEDQQMDPEGLKKVGGQWYKKYLLPLFVMSNGTSDQGDVFRTRYIYDHLSVVRDMIKDGIDLRRFHYYSLFDVKNSVINRTGLSEVELEKNKIKLKNSGLFFQAVCRNRGIDKSIIDLFLKK